MSERYLTYWGRNIESLTPEGAQQALEELVLPGMYDWDYFDRYNNTVERLRKIAEDTDATVNDGP